MSVDTLILRSSGILLGILFIAAALSACGDSSAPANQVSPSSAFLILNRYRDLMVSLL